MEKSKVENRIRTIVKEEIQRVMNENRQITADDIFREVLDNIYQLEQGEMRIPILLNDIMIPTQDDYLCASFSDEKTLNVEYKGKDINVPCDIKMISKRNYEYIARCIMFGFARIMLAK